MAIEARHSQACICPVQVAGRHNKRIWQRQYHEQLRVHEDGLWFKPSNFRCRAGGGGGHFSDISAPRVTCCATAQSFERIIRRNYLQG